MIFLKVKFDFNCLPSPSRAFPFARVACATPVSAIPVGLAQWRKVKTFMMTINGRATPTAQPAQGFKTPYKFAFFLLAHPLLRRLSMNIRLSISVFAQKVMLLWMKLGLICRNVILRGNNSAGISYFQSASRV